MLPFLMQIEEFRVTPCQALEGRIERARIEKTVIGVTDDRNRRERDQNALENRRQIFGFAVPVRMVLVRRLGAEPESGGGGDRGDDVDDAFERIRIEGD